MTNLCREAAYGPVREAAGNLQHITAEEVSVYPEVVYTTYVSRLQNHRIASLVVSVQKL